MRIALVGAGLALMAGGLTACGGSGDDAPGDASSEDFCGSFAKVSRSGDDFDKTKDAFQDLKDTGTPDNMPDDAREGFEILTDIATNADSEKDATKKAEDLSADDEKKVTKFIAYTAKECSDALSDLASDLPSDLPTDLPTELPSDLPTEIPSELLSDIPSDLLSPSS